MTTELVTVEPSTTVMDAARAMFAVHAGSALVIDGDTLVGILTERDMLRAIAESTNADAVRVSPVSRLMTGGPTTVHPDMEAGEAMDVMLAGGFRHLPVMEGDRLVGIISMRDLAAGAAG
jgi:CBS domain-containing protein